MPRRHRRRPEETALDEERARGGFQRVGDGADGAWSVRYITRDRAMKTYRCPGCDHEISPGIAHIVAWPADLRGDLADRRHWHTGCWRARQHRLPVTRG